MKSKSSRFFRQRKDVEMLLKTTDMTKKEIANKVASGNINFVNDVEDDLISSGALPEKSETLAAVKPNEIVPAVNKTTEKQHTMPIAPAAPEITKKEQTSIKPVNTEKKSHAAVNKAPSHTYTIDDVAALMSTKTAEDIAVLSKRIGVSEIALKDKRNRLRKRLNIGVISDEEARAIFVTDENGYTSTNTIPIEKVSRTEIRDALGVSAWTVTQAAHCRSTVSKNTRLAVLNKAKEIYFAKKSGTAIQNAAIKTTPANDKEGSKTAEITQPAPVESISSKEDANAVEPDTIDKIGTTAVSIVDDLTHIKDKVLSIARACDEVVEISGKKTRESILLRALIKEDKKFFMLTNAASPEEAQKTYLIQCGFTEEEASEYMTNSGD